MVSWTGTVALRPGRPGRWLAVIAPVAVAAFVIAIVWPGLMPDVGFWDTGEFQTILPIMGTAHPTGYPTYVLVGWTVNLLLTPLGEPAFRMNVLSLLFVAAAAAATVHLVARLTGRTPIAMAAGVAVALAPSTWRLATHADPHTLHLALVAILLVLLVRWEQARKARPASADRWLVAASIVFGLSVGNHSLTLLLAVPVGLFVLSVQPGILLRPRLMALCAAALLGTLTAVYLELPLRAGPFRAPLVYGRPDTWDGFWYIALAEQFRGSLHDPLGELPRKFAELAKLTSAQFGMMAPLIPVAFLATALRHWRYALLTGSAMLITLTFNASYSNADIGRYYLGPILWAWTWLAVLAALFVEQIARAMDVDGPAGEVTVDESATGDAPDGAAEDIAPETPTTQGTRPGPAGPILAVVLGGLLLLPTAADVGIRAELADSSHDTAARRWVTAVLANVEPNAVIVSWWSTSTVLWYAQFVDQLRPDITVVDDRTRLDRNYGEATDVIALFLGSRPVYVIRANGYDLGLVLAQYDLEPIGAQSVSDVYRVVGVRGSGG
ncbi:MAG: DUF2723 domain-containing protein [Chloroflexota bacterium]